MINRAYPGLLTLTMKTPQSFQTSATSTPKYNIPNALNLKQYCCVNRKFSQNDKRISQLHGTLEHNRDLHYRRPPKYCREPVFWFVRSDLGFCASYCGRYCHLPSVTRVGWTTLTSSRVILHVICILIIYSSRFWSSVASSWSDLVMEQCT
jgi:hypothetical protein